MCVQLRVASPCAAAEGSSSLTCQDKYPFITNHPPPLFLWCKGAWRKGHNPLCLAWLQEYASVYLFREIWRDTCTLKSLRENQVSRPGLQTTNLRSKPPLTTHSSCFQSTSTIPHQILLILLPTSCPSFRVVITFPVFASNPRKIPSSPFTHTPDPSGRQTTCGVE